MHAIPHLAVVLLWPSMLPWLLATALPLVLGWLALRRPRRVRWGAIDLVERAARSAGLTRGGLPPALTIVRMLLVACAAFAAARPLLPGGAGVSGTPIVAGDAARRIEVVAADGPHGLWAIRPALEAMARTRGRQFPTVVSLPLSAAGRSSAERQLIILGDGVVPDANDGARIAAAVRGGAALLVCLGPDSVAAPVLPRVSGWLETLVGASVAGSMPLDDAIDAWSGDDGAAFEQLVGPRVRRAAELLLSASGRPSFAVLARTATSGRPLVAEAALGQGRVCVSALPLALVGVTATDAIEARDEEWSDLAAWPAFVPFLDRLVSHLLGPPFPMASRGPRWFGGMPLARLLVAAALALALVECWLSMRQTTPPDSSSTRIPLAARVGSVVVLGAMFAAWGGLPPARAVPSRQRAAPVALVIDTSPSMTALDVVLGQKSIPGILDRLARDRPVEIHLATDGIRSLGRYPADVSAEKLRHLNALPPAPDASRLGDAVAALLEDGRAERPAAIVVMTDGAITGGASWAEVASIAGRRGVPLVAVPVGGGSPEAAGLPAGFRFTAIDPPAVCRSGATISIPVRARGSTSGSALSLAGDGGVGHLAPVSPATRSGFVFAGRHQLPAGDAEVTQVRTVTVAAGDGGVESHVGTASCVVTADPLRVLIVDRAPRYEFRFLERLLMRDPECDVTSRLLVASGTDVVRCAGSLPRSADEWSAFDVVVLGDVPIAAAEDAEPWVALREAVSHDGVGVVWLPGPRWAEADAGLPGWLPARVPQSAMSMAVPARPQRLRILPQARGAGWFASEGMAESTAAAFAPATFSSLPPVAIPPTARVVAVTDEAAGERLRPAIVVGRVGRGTVVGHLCDTWRWQGDVATGKVSDHERYWSHLVPRLAAPRRLARLLAATVDVRPLDPLVGEPVRVDLVPTRPTTDLAGWELTVDAPDGAVRRIGIAGTAPGAVTSLRLDGLVAGRHRLRLVPAGGAAKDLPMTPIAREIIVNEPLVEQAVAADGTEPLRLAIESDGGAVVSLDRSDTLPDTIAAHAASHEDRRAFGGHWLGSRATAHLLLGALVAACAVAWWPRPIVSSPRESLESTVAT